MTSPVLCQKEARALYQFTSTCCDAMAAEKGLTRSCYGVQTYTPEEIKQQWREFIKRESVTKNRCSIFRSPGQKLVEHSSALDFSRNFTYFNNNKKNNNKSTYDRMFHIQHGYCSRIHRDDREHTRGLDVHAEEHSKAVPILSSSAYGHRPPLEVPSRMHVRVGLVKRDFYRHCGATIPNGD